MRSVVGFGRILGEVLDRAHGCSHHGANESPNQPPVPEKLASGCVIGAGGPRFVAQERAVRAVVPDRESNAILA
jgi:hypothetical protein